MRLRRFSQAGNQVVEGVSASFQHPSTNGHHPCPPVSVYMMKHLVQLVAVQGLEPRTLRI